MIIVTTDLITLNYEYTFFNKLWGIIMFIKDLLKNKTFIITGGGTGLGRSMAERMHELGANIVISGRREDVLEKTVAEIDLDKTGRIYGVPCDVRKPEQVKEMVAKTVEKYSAVNGLINNAAGNFISPTERLSPGGFKVVVDIVLNGTFHCTLEVGKAMIAQKTGGSVLNIVTTYAWTGSGYVIPSVAAKAGVLAMTRGLAVEWAKYGIRTNAIAPGPFPTPGAWQRLVPKPYEQAMIDRIPLKRFGEHEELANLATYLMSDQAGYINGDVVTIDGGEWLKGAGQFNQLENLPAEIWEEMAKKRS